MKSLLWKRTLCCLLSMILILGNLPVFSFAEESDGLCEHHTFHTSECGYSPAIPGSPCTHEHTQDCYQTVAECIHVHDDACGYNEEAGDASCAHVCSEEYGCFRLVPDCHHAHDESCGYVEAVLEQPCAYSCTECAEPGEDPSEPEADEAVEAVRALIEALPSLEEIKAMSTQEQSEVYTQVQKAYDAYDALTSDQKAQLPEAEEIFTSLFEYFNSLTAPTSDVLASGTCGDNLTWELTDDGVLTISGTGEMVSYDSQSDTPWYSYLSNIQKIVIEDGITSIGDYAFGVATYPNVSSVTVPQSVTKLGLYAFGGNNIQIHYPGTMEQWLSLDFYFRADTWAAPGAVCSDGTILTLGFCGEYGVSGSPRYVLTGDGCMRIYGTGDMQFNKNLTNRSHWSSYNSSITSVVVEDGVTSIADYSFDRCKNLTTVTLPDNLRSIGTYAFRSCTALKAIDIPSSVTYLGSGVFQSSGLESIEIPEGVKYIKDYSFLNCSALSSVTIPSSVTDIGGQAFYGCSVLTDIYYGSDEQAWNQITIAANNDSLSSATIHYTNPCAEGHTEETIPGKAATCTEDGLTDGKKCSVCGEILEEQQVIPAGHTFVNGVCSGCGAITGTCGEKLTWVLTSDGVLTINGTGDMFDYTSVSSTPWYSHKSSITSLVVTEGVTSIGSNAFRATGLESVSFGNASLSLGTYSFAYCDSLKSIDFGSGTIQPGEYVFTGCTTLTSVHVPQNVVMNGSYSGIGSGLGMFTSCSSLQTATVDCGYVGPFFLESCYGMTQATFTNPNVQFYYLKNDSGHPFNAGSKTMNVNVVGCLCSQVNVLVQKGQRSDITLSFSQIAGDTTQHTEQVLPGTATCTEAGLSEGKVCSVCGYVIEKQTNVGALGHTEETIPGKAATCTADGMTDGKKCSVCGEILEEQTVIPAGHNFVDGVCSGCGAITGSCGAKGDNLTYLLTTDGVLTISGSGEMAAYSESSPAPWYSERTRITSVVLTDGVTSIGYNAFFGCSSLTSVTIPEGVSSIGNSAFRGCSALTDLTIPEGVSSVKDFTFEGCSGLTSVTIPDGVSSIGSYAFKDCSSLTSVTIPDSVSSIGASTFRGCSGLTSVTIPDSVSSIGSSAFEGCSSLTSVTIPDGVSSIESGTFSGCSGLTSVTIPKGVTSIGGYAFSGCSGLTSVTIPEGVTAIRSGAFSGCSKLTSVTIPEGVTSIESGTFSGCSGLTSVTIPKGVTAIGNYAFSKCSSLTSVTIPEGVTAIGSSAFHSCSSLTSVTIPEGVTAIGSSAFYSCSSLTDLTIPDSVTSIGNSAFHSCSSLTSVTIPKGVSSIEILTFCGCSSLTSVTISEGVSSIGSGSFSSCSSLTTVQFLGDGFTGADNIFMYPVTAYYPHGNTTWTQEIRDSFTSRVTWKEACIGALEHTEITDEAKAPTCTETGLTEGSHCSVCGTVLVAQEEISATGHTEKTIPGKAATCTEDGLTDGKKCSVCGEILEEQQTIPAGHNFVDGVCSGCGAITGSCGANGDNLTYLLTTDGKLTISGSGKMADYSYLTSNYAPWYSECTRITSVVLTDGVTSIGSYAFCACSGLTSVTIPDSVSSIGDYAFCVCSGLTSVAIPDSVSSIGSWAFQDCSSLTSVTIPNGVSSIENGTFFACSGLTSVTIPDSVSSIGDYAFCGCSGLTSVAIPDSVSSIGSQAFVDCSSLTSVTIPDGVSSIEEYTFIGCSSLTSVTIPDSVSSIGGRAFENCSGLTSVTIPDGVSSIEWDTFHGCSSLTDLTIPKSVTSIGSSAFYECSGLTDLTIPEGVTYIGSEAFSGCSKLTTVQFLGDGFTGTADIFNNPVTAYYPHGNTTWTQEIRDSYGSLVTWVEEGAERLLELAGTGLENEQVVWIDGVAVPVQKDGSGNSYVTLPENSSPILVTYSFNTGSGDRHTQYPTGMKVYRIVETENGPTVEHLPELDNLLQYSGCSIRIVGVKGIRMITSISKSTRSALMGDGLAGYKLVEYGTALCRASALEGGAPMVLGTPGVKSNYAYKRGVADPIFKDTGSLIQYTNVLVGFTDEDCKEDIAMRPYIILEDEKGETVTLYGGTVYRSIGYIAYQNRSAFAPGTAAYDYVWNIIHYVYGDQYDADYKG